MRRLEWTQIARTDLLDIIGYVADDNPDAAQRLKNDVETKAARLPEFPELFRKGRIQGTREIVVRTHYIVVYSDDALHVRVLRVLHASRQWPPME